MWTSAAPTTAGMPHPRATTAACETRPPREVSKPAETCMPSTSSGVVSRRMRMTASPCSAAASAAAADSTMRPLAAPGDAGRPTARGSAVAGCRRAWKNRARSAGCTECRAAATASWSPAAAAARTAAVIRSATSPDMLDNVANRSNNVCPVSNGTGRRANPPQPRGSLIRDRETGAGDVVGTLAADGSSAADRRGPCSAVRFLSVGCGGTRTSKQAWRGVVPSLRWLARRTADRWGAGEITRGST